VGHAEVVVLDGVVAVAFLALFEVVGCGVGGREGDPAAVGRELESADAALMGGELLGLAAFRADEVDLRAIPAVGDEPQPRSIRRPPVPCAACLP